MTDLYVQLQAVLDALPQMAAMVHDGVPVQANLLWRQFFGNDAELGSSREWLVRVHADERAQAIAAWREFLLHGHAPAFECRLQDEHGAELWFEVRLGSVGANVPLQAVTMTDVSARRHLRHSLEQSLHLQDRMLDASMDCIQVINIDGSVRHMNRSGCIVSGLSQDERAFGMLWTDLLPAAFRQKGRRALAQAASGRAARFAGQTGSEGASSQFWDNILTPMF
ncbi:MAG: PAS domain-containing protein, partial [Stenotrophomonas sp.]